MRYDPATATFVNLTDAGIIDPTQVTRSALQNAASVAGLLLTTEVLIAALPVKAYAHHSNGHMDGMDFSASPPPTDPASVLLRDEMEASAAQVTIG